MMLFYLHIVLESLQFGKTCLILSFSTRIFQIGVLLFGAHHYYFSIGSSFIYYLSSCVLVAIVDVLVVVAVVVVVGVVAMLVLVSVVVLLAVVVLLVLGYAYLLFESFSLIWIWGGSGCDVVRWSGQS